MSGGVVTLGETMALFRPRGSERLERTVGVTVGVGGAESNVAIGVARLGGRAMWIGRVGDDELGRRVVREVRGEGVDVRAIVDPAPTGLMLKETRPGGGTQVRYYRAGSAGSRLSPDDIPSTEVASAGVLHVTGITPALSDSAGAAVDAAVEAARAAGVPVSFDVNHRASLWSDRDAAEAYRRLAVRSDIVFAGPEEAAIVLGTGTPEGLVRRMADLGPRQAILKLGSRGCLAIVDGTEYVMPAIPVPVVDSVGAGDAFVAGYLSALLAGGAAHDRLDLGTRCGAFACLGEGDWESLPRMDELDGLDRTGDPVIR